MLGRIGGMGLCCAGLCYAEKFLSAQVLAKFAPSLVAPSPMLGVSPPPPPPVGPQSQPTARVDCAH